MLTPDYLDSLPDALVSLWRQVEDDILRDIARRIVKADGLTETAAWQLWRYEQTQALHQDVAGLLARYSGRTQGQIRRVLQQAARETLASDDEIYRALGFSPPDVNTSPQLLNLLNAGYRQTWGAWRNLTATTADTVTGEFEDAMDRAWLQASTGAFDYSTAARRAVDDLAKRGLKAIRYPSGHTDTLEVAVRRCVLTGVNQTACGLQLARMEEMGCEYVKVSAHGGARSDGSRGPADHAYWQGKVYHIGGEVLLDGVLYPDFADATGYGSGEGLAGWNCRHNFHPFWPGLSARNYTEERLEALNARDVAYDGRLYTRYEIRQMRRGLERRVRAAKRRYIAAQASGGDTAAAAARLQNARRALADFVNAADEGRTDSARTAVQGFGHSEAGKAVWEARKQEFTTIANPVILEPSKQIGGNPDVNFVCRLDKELYSVVSSEIETTEVVITDQQIVHINEGHPGMYERLSPYLTEIIQDPDYILRANRPSSALVLKRIALEDTVAEVVLRLKVAGDPKDYKNSIISLWGISEKRYRRLLRQSEILYKHEFL